MFWGRDADLYGILSNKWEFEIFPNLFFIVVILPSRVLKIKPSSLFQLQVGRKTHCCAPDFKQNQDLKILAPIWTVTVSSKALYDDFHQTKITRMATFFLRILKAARLQRVQVKLFDRILNLLYLKFTLLLLQTGSKAFLTVSSMAQHRRFAFLVTLYCSCFFLLFSFLFFPFLVKSGTGDIAALVQFRLKLGIRPLYLDGCVVKNKKKGSITNYCTRSNTI